MSEAAYALLLFLRLAIIQIDPMVFSRESISIKIFFTSLELKLEVESSQPSVADCVQLCRGEYVCERITVCDYSKLTSIQVIMKLVGYTPLECKKLHSMCRTL